MSRIPTETKKIPYVNLAGQHRPLKAELIKAAEEVIDSGQFILGPQVATFEEKLAAVCGTKFAVGVANGTDALVIALRAINIGPGDEVITAPNSFVASASAIALVGAKPVFSDVGDDYNLDPAMLEKAITEKTKAVIPVHLTGRAADMDGILAVARKHKLGVIEDSAQAVAAEYRGKRVGSFGDFGCFSLHPLKTLNALGDGGALTTNDPKLYERVKVLRNLGLPTRENCVAWSGNSRLDTLQAAMLLVKLKHLDEWTEARRKNAAFYRKALVGIDGLTPPSEKPHEKPVYHTFVIQADRRDQLKAFLAENGVETAIHYPIPIHLQQAAAALGYGQGKFPVAEKQASRILSLPVYPELTEDDLTYVADLIRAFFR